MAVWSTKWEKKPGRNVRYQLRCPFGALGLSITHKTTDKIFYAASLLDFNTKTQRNDDTTSSALRAECPQRLALGGSGS